MSRLTRVAAYAGLMMVSCALAVQGQEKEREIKKVGIWQIKVHDDRGKVTRCSMTLVAPDGMLRFSDMSNGTWSMSIPSVGLPDGSDIPGSAQVGRKTVKYRYHVTGRGRPRHCRTRMGSMVDGPLLVTIGSLKFNWKLAGMNAAVRATEDCLLSNTRGPAPLTRPRR